MINKQNVRIKLTLPEAKCPVLGTDFAAGFDLVTHEAVRLQPGARIKLDTGIAVQLPEGTCGIIRPRSSASKKGLMCQGVLDSDYTGNIMILLVNLSDDVVELLPGNAYAQMLILPYITPNFEVVDSLDQTVRGEKGFGSTGQTNLADK